MGRGAAIVLAFLGGCCWFAESPSRTVAAPPAAEAPARPPGEPPLRVLLFADFGYATCQQDRVAEAMARATLEAPYDLALAAGDNLYLCGPDATRGAACAFGPDQATVDPSWQAPDDPVFRVLHEDALAGLRRRGGGQLPVHLALGNHDVRADGGCAVPRLSGVETGRRRACLEVAHRSPAWSMPGRHYVLEAGPARFVVLDSNLLVDDYGGFDAGGEAAFAAGALDGCGARPCFVVLHHPPASAGQHGLALRPERLAALETAVAGRASAWIGGHDHDLQHLRTAAGADVFVSGNASGGRPSERFGRVEPSGASLLFASTRWGFATLEVWGSGAWEVRFEDVGGHALHCCRAALAAGPCLPAECG